MEYNGESEGPTLGWIESGEWVEYTKRFLLHQNFPNPFNPITTLRYEKIIGFSETAWKERKWESIDNRKLREEDMLKSWNIFANTIAKKDLPRLYSIFGGFNYSESILSSTEQINSAYANGSPMGSTIEHSQDKAPSFFISKYLLL